MKANVMRNAAVAVLAAGMIFAGGTAVYADVATVDEEASAGESAAVEVVEALGAEAPEAELLDAEAPDAEAPDAPAEELIPPLPNKYANDPLYADALRTNSISADEPLPAEWARVWAESIGDLDYSYIEHVDGSWVVWAWNRVSEEFTTMSSDGTETVQTAQEREEALDAAFKEAAADAVAKITATDATN